MPFHVAAHWRSCIYFVRFVNDAQQTLDAITFSVSATGMLLMIKRYQSQFVFGYLGNIFQFCYGSSRDSCWW